MKRRNLQLCLAGLLAAASIHCGSAPDSQVAGEEADTAAVEESVSVSGSGYAYCWAQIERASPSDAVLPAGTQLKLRANPNVICPPGVTNTLLYRFYVEGPSGKLSPMGPNEWSASRIVPFDTTGLMPGRYRIYLYSLPESLHAAWLAGDPTALAAAHRSGYSYTTFEDGLVVDGTASAVTAEGQDLSWSGASYWAIGDTNASGLSYYFEIDFATKPTAAGTYTTVDDSVTWPLGANQATVWVMTADTDWWTQASSATVDVVTAADGKLHALFHDPALQASDATTRAVSLDVTLP